MLNAHEDLDNYERKQFPIPPYIQRSVSAPAIAEHVRDQSTFQTHDLLEGNLAFHFKNFVTGLRGYPPCLSVRGKTTPPLSHHPNYLYLTSAPLNSSFTKAGRARFDESLEIESPHGGR